MTAPPSADLNESAFDRDAVLTLLEEVIHVAHHHVTTTEIESSDDARLKIKWCRTFGYLVGQYRKLQKDTDIDEMEESLELLQEVTGLEDDS